MTAPSLDALAAAAAGHLAALGSACVHPTRPTPTWRCGWCSGCVADGVAQDTLGDGAEAHARGLVAAVDALRAAEARRDALAAAVREEREACRRLPAHYDADYASSEERARVGALIDAHDAAEEHLDALLAAAPPRSTVDARVVREYLAADAAHWREINNVNGLHDPGRAGRCAATQGTRDAARAALDAALAGCV